MDANKVSLQNQQLAVTLAKNDAKDLSSVAKKVGDSVSTSPKAEPLSKAEFLKKGNEEVAKAATKLGEASGKPEAGFLNQIVKPTSVFAPVTIKPETGKSVVAEQRSHVEGMSTKDKAPTEKPQTAGQTAIEPKKEGSAAKVSAEQINKNLLAYLQAKPAEHEVQKTKQTEHLA